ncbi:MAG TPA: DUF1844 domain-containing protein [Planctomycetota bacterium]|nr:DUF1844 domain-containing protein [Planctomycetota bacterium]
MPDDEKGEEAAAKDQAPPEQEKDGSADTAAETPEAKFAILVSSIATQVLVSLGQIENPLSKKKEVDLKSAKFSIDLLQMLADKTRGNLADAEKRYLEDVLYRLRMGFVEASK